MGWILIQACRHAGMNLALQCLVFTKEAGLQAHEKRAGRPWIENIRKNPAVESGVSKNALITDEYDKGEAYGR